MLFRSVQRRASFFFIFYYQSLDVDPASWSLSAPAAKDLGDSSEPSEVPSTLQTGGQGQRLTSQNVYYCSTYTVLLPHIVHTQRC